MTRLTCHRLRTEFDDAQARDFDDFVEAPAEYLSHGPVAGNGFDAKLYISSSPAHEPPWGSFLAEGFGARLRLPRLASVSATLITRIEFRGSEVYFAFTFGPGGRYLLRGGAWERGFGLRTALNVLYPRGEPEEEAAGRLLALDAKRRGPSLVRSRSQASRGSEFETFDLDRYRDVVSAATGRPPETGAWGRRVTGGDAFQFSAEIAFAELGDVCRRLITAHQRTDYRERYAWLDDVRPVTDPEIVQRLEAQILGRLQERRVEDLDLAPPQIVDWERVDSFRFHFDRRPLIRPEMRLQDYLRGVDHKRGLENVDVGFLRRNRIEALGAESEVVHSWPVWRCLFGEVSLGSETYTLDEGDFFAVSRSYLDELDDVIGSIPESAAQVPDAQPWMHEDEYNRRAADAYPGRLLLDRQTVRSEARTTAVEVCDILTSDRQLIHVKRELGSRNLSHLLAQGLVSSELLQEDEDFRAAVREKITALGSRDHATLFEGAFRPADFEVAYAIIADWRDRNLAEALPFFSKVNLRSTLRRLSNRGFSVTHRRINYDHSGPPAR